MTTGEGAGLPGPSRAGGVELSGTVQQQLVFLNTHWGGKYSFAAPAKPRDRWTAAAEFGQHEELTGENGGGTAGAGTHPLPGEQAVRGRAVTSYAPVIDETSHGCPAAGAFTGHGMDDARITGILASVAAQRTPDRRGQESGLFCEVRAGDC
jgi:hypothetical protein